MGRRRKKYQRRRTEGPSGLLGADKKLPAHVLGRKRLISKFGLTERKIALVAEGLKKRKVENWGVYAPLFCVMRKTLGSLRSKKILELGSATADFASVLKKLGAKVAVMDKVGVNPRAGVEGHKGVFEDVGKLFGGRNFDAIISNLSFGVFTAKRELALNGMFSALKPGGYLIVSADKLPEINEKDLKNAGFKIILFAKDLPRRYGLEILIEGNVFIAQKPIKKAMVEKK